MILTSGQSSARWRSRTTFVLALSAAAVGLGSLWRFAWLMGEHGGGAFMLAYVVSLFLLAVPLLCAEVVLGCYGRAGPIRSIRHACDRSLRSRHWQWFGALAVLTGMLILAYQAVVAGWTLAYVEVMLSEQLSAASAPFVADHFAGLLADGEAQLKWQSLFLAAVVAVLALGITNGLGVLVWLLVPLLIALLGLLVRFALDTGDLEAAGDFLFSVKLVDFDAEAMLAAFSHAALTLGIGMGVGTVYGAYSPERIPIGRSVMAVAVFDTVVALLAGIAIFPVVFANNTEPASGPTLLFISAPYAFANVSQGDLFGSLFFALVGVAALGSAVAMLEPAVATLQQHLRLRRPLAALVAGAAVWLLAWRVSESVAASQLDGTPGLLQLLDLLAAQLLLPLLCLLLALLVGWLLRPQVLRPQFARESDLSFSHWRGLMRYIAPPALLLLIWAGQNF
ncbi:sodium-dependent transporter [Pseudohalioglobus sediminis]|uniref:Sodium-dependent transporter n=1 Tax=Pseudohalioglobus sediminis TaxID=2606449 RepID=A0A5B0X838_9GAMM|nr:sodium-dependent transporter [Pseudohalioglobus sediminis]KAA1194597.1 sodium-dependent transporter [Pseudohalioglobus sediminis]